VWRRSAYDNSREVEASEVKGLITEVGGSAPAGLITLLRAFVLFLVHGLPGFKKGVLLLAECKKSVGRSVVNHPGCVCRTCIQICE
jgi:hypothetical protein